MQRLEDTSTPVSVGMAILGYSLCSSTLLLANKMAIEHLPVPSVVSFIQILSSAVFILVIKVFGVSVDSLEWYVRAVGCTDALTLSYTPF